MEGIDVVIPTGKKIEESHYSICYTIRSIIAQTIQPASITIVENGLDLGVKEVVKRYYGGFVNVISGTQKRPNISFARNLGARQGKSDKILFLDDDVILGYTDYFSRITNILKNSDFSCGAMRFWTPVNWYEFLSLDYPLKHNLLILKDISFLPQSIERTTGDRNCSEYSYIGNFGVIKRSVFEEVGGFDEAYEGWLYQDSDLIMRLVEKEYQYEIMSYTNMFCFHLSHPAEKTEYRKVNYERYLKKQQDLKVQFNNKHFFGRFDGDDRMVIRKTD